MQFSLSANGIRGILLDIEGTATSVEFVYKVLFPFARNQLQAYVDAHNGPEFQAIQRALEAEYDSDVSEDLAPPPWTDPPIDYIAWLMDHDRKSTALKALQGRIWEQGYREGKLHGVVFDDVPPALQQWHRHSFDVRIFSSGSELAQRLLFSSTAAGDLTIFITGYFDTNVGAKIDPGSYASIAGSFQLQPQRILFISDVTRELDAAKRTGYGTLMCVRPGNQPQPVHDHPVITSFSQIAL